MNQKSENVETVLRYRKGMLKDVRAITNIINYWAQKGNMLPRSDENVAMSIRDFIICESPDAEVMGCVALHIYGIDLAELRSLAVAEKCTRMGIGQQLVIVCLKEAETLGIKNVFALTYLPEFFTRLKFQIVDKSLLPHKIWKDCLNCDMFEDCKEISVLYTFPR